MVIALLFCGLPLSSSGAEGATESSGSGIHRVEASGEEISVFWHGDRDALSAVTVEIYNDAYTALLSTKTFPFDAISTVTEPIDFAPTGKLVQPGLNHVSIVNVGALPFADGFFLRLWLVNSGGARAGEAFECATYTKRMQTLINQTPSDFPDRRVVDVSAFYGAGSFIVLDEETVLFAESTPLQIAASEGGASFALTGLSESEKSALHPAQVVCIVEDTGEFHGIRIAEIQHGSEGQLLIRADSEALSIRDYCEASQLRMSKYSFHKDVSYSNTDFSLEGTLQVELTIGFSHNETDVFYRFETDYKLLESNLTLATPSLEKSISLITIPLVGIPYAADIEFTVDLTISANVTGSIVFDIAGDLGFEVSGGLSGLHVTNLSRAPQLAFDGFAAEGSLYLGIGIGPQLSLIKILTMGVSLNSGYQATGILDSVEYRDEKNAGMPAGASVACAAICNTACLAPSMQASDRFQNQRNGTFTGRPSFPIGIIRSHLRTEASIRQGNIIALTRMRARCGISTFTPYGMSAIM